MTTTTDRTEQLTHARREARTARRLYITAMTPQAKAAAKKSLDLWTTVVARLELSR